MKRLIGLVGKKRAGKDSLFNIIKQRIPKAVRFAFADELKIELAHALGTTVEDIEENKAFYRPALQLWGTDIRRDMYGKDYWIKKIQAKIESLPDDAVAVITDCRFANEAELVERIGGEVVRVIRLNHDDKENAAHVTETEQENIPCSYTIRAGSLEELSAQANQWMNQNINYL